MTNEIPEGRPGRHREYSGPGSTLGAAALVVLAVGFVVWQFGLRTPGVPGAADDGLGVVPLPAALNPTGRPPAALEGRAAPNFRLATLEGGAAALSEFRGRYVLVNFWASWCGPCRAETPALQALHARAGGERLAIVGVNQQEAPADAAAFTRQFGVTYTIVLDRDGEVSRAYAVGRGLPISFFLDPNGVVLAVFLGQLSEEAISRIEAEASP